MLMLKDRIKTLWTYSALQYNFLQCNVVIRESFLFRYSAIPYSGFQCFPTATLYKLKQVDILTSKNQALQILYLKHHDNVYKTSYIIMDKKLTKSMKI